MRVTDEAILKIRDLIASGELAPGDRLPPEKELGETLGLSRGSLREAVKGLAAIRVLDVRRGDGTYVTSLEPELLLEALSFVVDLHDDDSVLEILAVRRILEPGAAALAAARSTETEVAELREMTRRAEVSADVEELVAHDLLFHRRVADLSGNRYLSSLIDSLASRTVRARIWRGVTQDGAVDRTLGEHHAILDALLLRDGELASALTAAHIAGVENWVRVAGGSD